jgi:hypothetical protein
MLPEALSMELSKHIQSIILHTTVDICVHSYLNPVGGYGRSALDLATSLRQFNFSVAFIAVGQTDPVIVESLDDNSK